MAQIVHSTIDLKLTIHSRKLTHHGRSVELQQNFPSCWLRFKPLLAFGPLQVSTCLWRSTYLADLGLLDVFGDLTNRHRFCRISCVVSNGPVCKPIRHKEWYCFLRKLKVVAPARLIVRSRYWRLIGVPYAMDSKYRVVVSWVILDTSALWQHRRWITSSGQDWYDIIPPQESSVHVSPWSFSNLLREQKLSCRTSDVLSKRTLHSCLCILTEYSICCKTRSLWSIN